MAKYMFSKYLDYQFDPLEPDEEISFEKYCGPTPESNWVIPNRLLVGAYPASADDPETFRLLTSIMTLGITKFVCLQLEYRSNGVTETMWRNGQALRPYFEDVKKIAKNRHRFTQIDGVCPIAEESSYSFVHFPIRDCSVTDDDIVVELSFKLAVAISNNEKLYIHCWGGHGRTGTIVSIMLHIMYGLSAVECMRRCQMVHDLREAPVAVGSPQTMTQRNQVIRVIAKLQQQSNIPKISIKNKTTNSTPSTALSESSESKLNNNDSNNNNYNSSSSVKSTDKKSSTNIIYNSIIPNSKDAISAKTTKSSRPIQCPIITLTSNTVERTKNRITATNSTTTTNSASKESKKKNVVNSIKGPPLDSTLQNNNIYADDNNYNDVTMTDNVETVPPPVEAEKESNITTEANLNESEAMELQRETTSMEFDNEEEKEAEKKIEEPTVVLSVSNSSNDDHTTDSNSSSIFRSFSDIMCPAGAPLVLHLRSQSSSGGALDDFQKGNCCPSPPLSPDQISTSLLNSSVAPQHSWTDQNFAADGNIDVNMITSQPANNNNTNIDTSHHHHYFTSGMTTKIIPIPRPLQPPSPSSHHVHNVDTSDASSDNSLSSFKSPVKTSNSIPSPPPTIVVSPFQITSTTTSTTNTPSKKIIPLNISNTFSTINSNGFLTTSKDVTNQPQMTVSTNSLLSDSLVSLNNPINAASPHRNYSTEMNISNSKSSSSSSKSNEVNQEVISNPSVTLSFSEEEEGNEFSNIGGEADNAMCIDLPTSSIPLSISPLAVTEKASPNVTATTITSSSSMSCDCNAMELDDSKSTILLAAATTSSPTKSHFVSLVSSASVPSDVSVKSGKVTTDVTYASSSSGSAWGNGYLSDGESGAVVSAHRPEIPMNSSSSSGLQGRRNHKPKHPHSSSDSPPIISSKSIRCESPTGANGLLRDGIAVFLGAPLTIPSASLEESNLMSIVPSTPPGKNCTRPPLIAKRPAPV